MPTSKTRLLPAAQAAAFNTFRIKKQSIPPRRRSKFDSKRRQEVKAVRRKRACLRCALLHVSCSNHDVCIPCQRLALVLHAHEKQTLSFSGCIRTMPSEVSIFEAYFVPTDPQDLLVEKTQKLAMTTISLEFSSLVTWDLGFLVEDVVDWLNNPMLSETSKVGTLSSPQFLDLVKSSVEEDVIIDFHRMIYAISLAYTQPTAPDRHHLSIPELHQIGSMAGHKFLKTLDKRLKPQYLNNCSGDDLRSLFLLVFGTILAVGYVDSEVSSTAPNKNSQFKAMQSFLCQILAHYMIYLASQLKLRIASGADEFILQAAPARWHKQGLFQWATEHEEDFELPLSLDSCQSSALNNFSECPLDVFANSLESPSTCQAYQEYLKRRRGIDNFLKVSSMADDWPIQGVHEEPFENHNIASPKDKNHDIQNAADIILDHFSVPSLHLEEEYKCGEGSCYKQRRSCVQAATTPASKTGSYSTPTVECFSDKAGDILHVFGMGDENLQEDRPDGPKLPDHPCFDWQQRPCKEGESCRWELYEAREARRERQSYGHRDRRPKISHLNAKHLSARLEDGHTYSLQTNHDITNEPANAHVCVDYTMPAEALFMQEFLLV